MPSLPRKNTLDYNPDSLINASKKMSVIALENMKNPTLDPDQATLSTLDATRRLGDSIDTLDYLAGLFHSAVLRIQNLVAPVVGAGRKVGGGKGDKKKRAEPVSGIDAVISPNKAIGDSSSSSGSSSVHSWNDWGDIGRGAEVAEFQRRLQAVRDQQGRFSDRFQIGDQNPQARDTPEYRQRLDAIGDRFRQRLDAFGEREVPSSSSSMARFLYDPNNDKSVSGMGDTTLTGYAYNKGRDFDSDITGSSSGSSSSGGDGSSGGDSNFIDVAYDQTSWVASIFYLIQLTRRMDILVVSKIKPATNSLTQAQITKLGDIYKVVLTAYDDITDPFTRRREQRQVDPYTKVKLTSSRKGYGMTNIDEQYIRQNEYGDEILNTFNSERKKLLLDITVVVNSWKQNSPTGQQAEISGELTKDYENRAELNRQLFVDADVPNPQGGGGGDQDQVGVEGAGRRRFKKTGRTTLLGAGNNFYNEKIDDSRDIPCLLSSIRNCPTKYLL